MPDDILASENPFAAESVGELLVELFTGNAACPSILSAREKPEFEGRTVAHVLANAGHPFFHEFPPEVKNLVWTWTNPLTGEKTSLTVEETFARRKEFEAKKRSRQGDAR